MRRTLAAARFSLSDRLRRLHPDHAIAARAFDHAFYLKTNPDVFAAGADPLEHFMAYGWREGRDPTPDFSLGAYLAAFPEVASLGVNPFVHYLTNGRPKPRPAESPLGFRHEVISALLPVEARIALATAAPVAPDPEARLAAALARGARDGLRRLHITFSHDDFTANIGGLQLALQREAARLAELGRDHLHLYPARAWPVVRTATDPGALGVVLNGKAGGVFHADVVARALAGATAGAPDGRSFAIHSLLGHAADETVEILAAAGLSAGTFWLHDFASLCAGFHLLRNDVQDCAAPPPDSAGCSICVYGDWRARQVREHARLFQRLSLTVAAPSQVTLDLWRRAADYPVAATVVLPHARLTLREPASVGAGPFRLAFAGLTRAHKGWPIFRALAHRFADDPRYDFVHLGAARDPHSEIRFHAVVATPDRPLAMREALQAAHVDAVLVWPLCRETFSFVAYEAVAAGGAVLTGPDSGNVAAFVAETGHGRVLPDETALTTAFESGAILELARAKRRPMLYDLAYSALTLDLAQHPSS